MRYEVDGGNPYAVAGLWEFWKADDAEPIESCTIITTDANDLAAEVHDRMPVILDEGDYDDLLNGEEVPLDPFPAERMQATPVSTFVNNAWHEGEECIARR